VGVGAGLRFDFSFLVLRTDLAFPIRKPYLQEGDRWVLDQVRLGASSWRKENLVLTSPLAIHFNSCICTFIRVLLAFTKKSLPVVHLI
jgi:hypothetical protein